MFKFLLFSSLFVMFSLLPAVLNRAAGSNLFGLTIAGYKPLGHPAIYIAPLISTLALILGATMPIALAWGAAYLYWRLWPHGRWIDLKHDASDPNRIGIPMTRFERVITSLSFGNDYLALFWRHLTIWPGLVLVWYVGGPSWLLYGGPYIAALLVLGHWIGKLASKLDHHPIAELIHGLCLGNLIVTASSA